MNSRQYLSVAVTVALAYTFNLLFPVAWIGFLASLPLLTIRKKYALLLGFLIGLIVPMSLYLMYPINMVTKLSVVMGQIAGIPPVLVIVIFPLFYGIVMGLSGLFWSGFAENPLVSKSFGYRERSKQEDRKGVSPDQL